jgi:hypothetical protein
MRSATWMEELLTSMLFSANLDEMDSSNQEIPKATFSQSNNTNHWILIILFNAIISGICGYFIETSKSMNNKLASQSTLSSYIPTITSPPAVKVKTDVSKWKTYTNKTYHYSFSYPSTWMLNTTPADPNPKAYDGTQITLTSPSGDVLTLEYNYATGAVPWHIYKSVPVTIAGHVFIKTYNDGCNFSANSYSQGRETPSYFDCANRSYTDEGIFQITYGLSKDVLNNTIPEYTTIQGKDASLRFEFNKHVPLGMENTPSFQQKDVILNSTLITARNVDCHNKV